MPAVIPEIETLVHDSLIRQAGVQLQRLTRRDSTRPESDVVEALRLLHLLLWDDFQCCLETHICNKFCYLILFSLCI